MDEATQRQDYSVKLIDGIGGSAAELEQYLEICLRAGYLKRAEKLLNRVKLNFGAGSKEAVRCQNVFLRELTGHAIWTSNESTYKIAQGYFERQMSGRGIQTDANNLAALINGCLLLLSGDERERTIRRYLEFADNHRLDVFDRDYYDDEQYTLLQKISNPEFQSSNIPDSAEIEENVKREDAVANSGPENTHKGAPEQSMPEVRSVQLKGLGLKALKESLAPFTSNNAQNEDLTEIFPEMSEEGMPPNSAEARQIRIERSALTAATERWRMENDAMKEMGINTTLHTKPVASLMWEWHLQLVPALKEEMSLIQEALSRDRSMGDNDRMHYGPFLSSVEPEKLSALVITHVLSALAMKGGAGGIRLAGLTKALGAQVEIESELRAFGGARLLQQLQKMPDKRRAMIRMRVNRAKFNLKGHRVGIDFTQDPSRPESSTNTARGSQQVKWSSALRVKVGAVLVSKLLETAKIQVSKEHPRTKEMLTELLPAFNHVYYWQRGKKRGHLDANLALVEKLTREPPSALIAKRLPMIVPPRPWTGFFEGGYFLEPIPVTKGKRSDKTQVSYVKAAADKGDMEQVFAGLTVLGKTAWRINQDVLKVQLQAWDTGEAITNFAPENPTLDSLPEPPKDSNDREAAATYRIAKARLDNERRGFHSKRCFQNFQLEVARAYRDETLYFPHALDFRGRAYPIPPYLNHMGADNARGLLTFANGKALGENGLRWLKIHLANVFGYDKASLRERENFTMQHLPDIRNAVTNPLDGNRWWLTAEDPWQTLAASFELTRALDSPDPASYISHLPIHQDGTCNGLQHYAALGGDNEGATQVNLEPGDRPADVYTGVAELIKEQCARDAENGHPQAKILQGKITRKVVKQTVMTNVYGVTFVGAREQVLRQLNDMIPELRGTDMLWKCAVYLAKGIFKALSTMFGGAHAIQRWFGHCADRISKSITAEQVKRFREAGTLKAGASLGRNEIKLQTSRLSDSIGCKSSVIWTTPLRMPVVQPYRTPKTKVVATSIQLISIAEPQIWDPVSRRKQMGGFPPNFIHSLDATHMFLSALKSDELGLSFASVHDSFWTHAGDVPVMNRLLRDAFVRMHSEDIVGRLAAEFEARYKGSWYLAGIYAKSEVGKKIQAWRKKNFGTAKDDDTEKRYARTYNTPLLQARELMIELDRLKDLESDDPEVRQQAEAMETPATILAGAEGDEEAFLAQAETAGLGVVDEKDSMADESPLSEGDKEALAHTETPGLGIAEERESMDSRRPLLEGSQEPIDISTTENVFIDGGAMEDSEDIAPGVPPSEKLTTLLKREKKKSKPAQKKFNVWIPITFPEVPKKGEFDVFRLKDSQYFFS
ncbi:MAG: hypothetical protein Q9157_004799 [Trypethelium eluteriae]